MGRRRKERRGGRTAGGVEVAEVGVEVFGRGGDGEVLEDGAEG